MDLRFAHPDQPALYHRQTAQGQALGIRFEVQRGEHVAILGINGSGKSTLLKLINGLLTPTSGQLIYQGHLMTAAWLKQQGRWFRQSCALLFQNPESMLFNPTVRDELAYAPRQLGLSDVDALVEAWSNKLGLQQQLNLAPYLLSGGQKQKVALGAIMIQNPDLLLLDEPSASLDPATVGWLIDELWDHPRTLLVATHHLSFARELAERCVVLGPMGEWLFDGSMDEALRDMVLMEKAGLAHRHRHRHHHRHNHAHEHSHPHLHPHEEDQN